MAYNDKTTHPALTDEIVDFYNLLYPNTPITAEQKELLIEGSTLLDKLFKGDCVIAVAAAKKDASLCQSALYQEDLINLCFYQISLMSGDKSLCSEIKDEKLSAHCLAEPPAPKDESKPRLSPIEKIKNFLHANY